MNQFQPNVLTLTFILSGPFSQGITFSSPEDFFDLPNFYLILANVVNLQGEPVIAPPVDIPGISREASINHFAAIPISPSVFIPIDSHCHWDSFHPALDSILYLSSLLPLSNASLVDTSFQIDTVTSSDEYVSCLDVVKQRLDVSTMPTVEYLTTCANSSDLDDPCCHTDLLPLLCCSPRPIEALELVYTPDPTSTETCQNPACSLSYLTTLATTLTNQETSYTSCAAESLSDLDILFLKNQAGEEIRNCLDASGFGSVFRGMPCQTDADCAPYPGAICSYQQGICINISLAQIEDQYLDCYIASLDPTGIIWLLEVVLPPAAANTQPGSPEFKAFLAEAASTFDCVAENPFDLSHRTRNATSGAQVFNSSAFNCLPQAVQSLYPPGQVLSSYDIERAVPWIDCMGTSCLLPPSEPIMDKCLDAHIYSLSYFSSPDKCNATGDVLCRFGACDAAPACAYCPPDGASPCVEVPNVASQAACDAQVVCELPDGSFQLGLTAAQCSALGECSVDCPGAQCRSARPGVAGACTVAAATTSAACSAALAARGMPGTFAAQACILTSVASALACGLQPGALWVDCAGLAACDRATPMGQHLQCFADMFMGCGSEAACTASGRCSDLDVLKYVDDYDPQDLQVRYAGCFDAGVYSTYAFGDDASGCAYNQFRVRNGCHSLAITQPAQCNNRNPRLAQIPNAAGVRWETAATSAQQCLAAVGCDLETNPEDRLAWRNATECAACGGVPRPFWTWTPGRWQRGAPRAAAWVARAAQPRNQWRPTLDFILLDDWYQEIIAARITYQLKSVAVCQYDLITSPLASIVCDCYGGSSCFQEQLTTSVAVGQVCGTINATLRWGTSYLHLNETSVVGALCASLLVSTISVNNYDIPAQPETVSFPLASRKRVPDRSVFRAGDGAIVGAILGDGVQLDLSSAGALQSATLCIHPTANASRSHPEYVAYDFGTSASLRPGRQPPPVRPLGLAVWQEADVSGNLLLCAALPAALLPSAQEQPSVRFFPIVTLSSEDMAAASKSSAYSSSDAALIYTLGALYSVVLAVVFVHFAFLFVNWRMGLIQLPMYWYSALFFLLLCVFRVVFMFAYPSGVWDANQTADFVVFELPTFFYFTSVVIILYALSGLYRSLGLLSVGNSAFTVLRWMSAALAVFLVICWLLFISVAISVGVIDSSSSSSACPGRAITSGASNNEIRQLSIAYQSIIIALALILALAFLFIAIYLSSLTSLSSNPKLRSMIICAVAITFGFLARCILFLIILSLDFVSTIYMFLTLIFTEIVVIMVLTGFFFFHHSENVSSSRSKVSTGSRKRSGSRPTPASRDTL